MRFEKWQALGNDYVIVERAELPFELTPARIRRLCKDHFGVSSVGVLVLSSPADPAHVADLRIFNPDGSEAELSGNGARQAILYLRRHLWTDKDIFSIHTAAGEIRPTITGVDTCIVGMGTASLSSQGYPSGGKDGLGTVTAGGRDWSFRHVSIGNPQCAIRVGSIVELESLDLGTIGPSIQSDAQFPNRTNVSWYTELESGPGAPSRIRARIFERGVGETLSSGTGAIGAAVAYLEESNMDRGVPVGRRVIVLLDAGELEVDVGSDLRINLTGWAKPVFAGRLSDEFIRELHRTE